MNLIQRTRAALAAAALVGGVLGASAAPGFAHAEALQPTQIAFTSPTSYQDPAKSFNSPDTTLNYWGIVSSNASGTVVLFDAGPNGDNRAIASVPVTNGQFSVTLPAFTQASLGSGTHLLTALYLGSDAFAPSSSPVFTEVIQGQHF
jgi:hypothetical protein